MGLFDTVVCDTPLPGSRVPRDKQFQSKSLGCGMNRYTITASGALVRHPVRGNGQERIPLDGIDVGYHGDILLYAITPNDEPAEYAARFTHGLLEWIRPLESVTELHRCQLIRSPSSVR